ncbi:MAG: hypothetical protein JWO31_171, partial [Phycisphaerales bacterium]|nr:hypothetical protein [Phycisphaerales bacterium]
GRLKAVQAKLGDKDGYRPLPEMMALSLREWNSALSLDNYDQAWAMCHFLASADPRYQGAFVDFIRAANRKVPPEKAWQQAFGSTDGFQKVWADWWLAQRPDATADLEARVTLATLASYAVRAQANKQLPADLDALVAGVGDGAIAFKGDDWLPPSLFKRAAAGLKRGKTTFALVPPDKTTPAKLTADRPDGTRLTAALPAKPIRPYKIAIEVDDLAPAVAKAQALADAGKKKEAKAALAEAVRRNPKASPAADAAKKLAAELR